MKKILSLFPIVILFACVSCGDDKTAGETKENSMAEKNLAASHVVNKAFETGNVSGLDSVIADNFLDHTDQGDKIGVDSLKAMVNWIHGNMKDMKMELVNEVADNDYVYSWMRYTGTSDGTMGMPAGPYDMHVIELSKFKDGKAVEHWAFLDMRDMMKMMPQAPQGDKMKMDKK